MQPKLHPDVESLERTNSADVDDPAISDEALTFATVLNNAASTDDEEGGRDVPLRMKLMAILLVTAIGFGSHWSSGVTGAMKSTLKKVSTDTPCNAGTGQAQC